MGREQYGTTKKRAQHGRRRTRTDTDRRARYRHARASGIQTRTGKRDTDTHGQEGYRHGRTSGLPSDGITHATGCGASDVSDKKNTMASFDAATPAARLLEERHELLEDVGILEHPVLARSLVGEDVASGVRMFTLCRDVLLAVHGCEIRMKA